MRERDIPQFDPERAAFELQLGWAQKHAANGGGFIGVMDEDNQHYPDQLHFHIDGSPQPADVIDSVTNSAPGPIAEMRKQMYEAEQQNRWISMTADLLAAGHTVAMVTNHTDLVDVAYAHSLISSEIMKIHAKRRPGTEFSRSVIINGIVEFMDFDLGGSRITGVNALKLLETDIFLSFPATESFEEKLLEITSNEDEREAIRKFAKGHNRRMRARLQAGMHRSNMFMAVAASGTTDNVELVTPTPPEGYDEQVSGLLIPQKRIHMARAGETTRKLLSGHRPGLLPDTEVYVLPVGVYYEALGKEHVDDPQEYEQVVFKIASHPQLANGPDSIDFAMALTAETLSAETDEHTEFHYPIAG